MGLSNAGRLSRLQDATRSQREISFFDISRDHTIGPALKRRGRFLQHHEGHASLASRPTATLKWTMILHIRYRYFTPLWASALQRQIGCSHGFSPSKQPDFNTIRTHQNSCCPSIRMRKWETKHERALAINFYHHALVNSLHFETSPTKMLLRES